MLTFHITHCNISAWLIHLPRRCLYSSTVRVPPEFISISVCILHFIFLLLEFRSHCQFILSYFFRMIFTFVSPCPHFPAAPERPLTGINLLQSSGIFSNQQIIETATFSSTLTLVPSLVCCPLNHGNVPVPFAFLHCGRIQL